MHPRGFDKASKDRPAAPPAAPGGRWEPEEAKIRQLEAALQGAALAAFRAAFDRFFDEWFDPVYAFAWQRDRDARRAELATRRIFLEALRSLGRAPKKTREVRRDPA